MELIKARTIAEAAVRELSPYCEKIEIGGSIRRKRPFVHDIDIVCIPSNQGKFITHLQNIGKIKIGGQKLIHVSGSEIGIDIYIALTATWATLLLIRTGSARHNVYLCSLARQKGMKLHADGSGLFKLAGDKEYRIAGDTEESIFQALGLVYKRPEERE